MSTHMPGLQSFFEFFCIILYWSNFVPAAYRVNLLYIMLLMLLVANLANTKMMQKTES